MALTQTSLPNGSDRYTIDADGDNRIPAPAGSRLLLGVGCENRQAEGDLDGALVEIMGKVSTVTAPITDSEGNAAQFNDAPGFASVEVPPSGELIVRVSNYSEDLQIECVLAPLVG